MSIHDSAYKSLQEKFSTQVSPCLGSSGQVRQFLISPKKTTTRQACGVSAQHWYACRVTHFICFRRCLRGRDNFMQGRADCTLTSACCGLLSGWDTRVPRVTAPPGLATGVTEPRTKSASEPVRVRFRV
jgi:hypothetical protein